jgi:hypothetical protein
MFWRLDGSVPVVGDNPTCLVLLCNELRGRILDLEDFGGHIDGTSFLKNHFNQLFFRLNKNRCTSKGTKR